MPVSSPPRALTSRGLGKLCSADTSCQQIACHLGHNCLHSLRIAFCSIHVRSISEAVAFTNSTNNGGLTGDTTYGGFRLVARSGRTTSCYGNAHGSRER